jgi:acyl CoA:acetate/3-ketoacid CoA transferase alpha subunit
MRKPVMTAAAAVADIADGAVLLAGGFGGSGYPLELFEALADRDVRGLTLICSNGGQGTDGAARLVMRGVQRVTGAKLYWDDVRVLTV